MLWTQNKTKVDLSPPPLDVSTVETEAPCFGSAPLWLRGLFCARIYEILSFLPLRCTKISGKRIISATKTRTGSRLAQWWPCSQ